MIRVLCFVAFAFVVSFCSIAISQQPELQQPELQQPDSQQPELPGPGKEHQWLQKFVGEWETNSEASVGPDQPPMNCAGTVTGKMLGGLWIINEIEGDMAGTTINAIQTIGYDPVKKKYMGTWVDSLVNHRWEYEGTVDESGRKLTLEAEGPNYMDAGKLTKFRDTYEFESADHIVATSWMMTEDGKWVSFVTGTMRRMK